MKKKKLISVILSICVLLSVFAGFNFTASAGDKSGTCGTGLQWTLTSDGVLSISGEGEMKDYDIVKNRAPWLSDASGIKTIVVENGVNYIGEYAFFSCINAAEIILPSSLWIISVSAFSGCIGIKNLQLPEGLEMIDDKAFYGCSNLEEITIPSTMVYIGEGVFAGCIKLSKVNYSGSVDDWNALLKAADNDVLNKATIYCTDGIINEKTEEPSTEEPSTEEPTEPSPDDEKSTTKDTPFTDSTTTTQSGVTVVTLPDWYYDWKYGKNSTTQNQTTRTTTETTTATQVQKPKKVTVSKVTAGKKQFKACWKKMSGVTGYQVQYSLKKNFKGAKTVKVKGAKKTSTTVKKLKSKKTYYVRVRAYKTVSGNTSYGSWSKTKTVKTK